LPGDDQQVHGVIGIHVDDGIGGGDKYFAEQIEKLNKIFPFGSWKHKEFIYTGIHMKQFPDYSISLDQAQYVHEIQPITVERYKRQNLKELVTERERSNLRALNGSLQYASVHTRADMSAKVGYLQTQVTKATVGTLL
jgi:hypothetical protein